MAWNVCFRTVSPFPSPQRLIIFMFFYLETEVNAVNQVDIDQVSSKIRNSMTVNYSYLIDFTHRYYSLLIFLSCYTLLAQVCYFAVFGKKRTDDGHRRRSTSGVRNHWGIICRIFTLHFDRTLWTQHENWSWLRRSFVSYFYSLYKTKSTVERELQVFTEEDMFKMHSISCTNEMIVKLQPIKNYHTVKNTIKPCVAVIYPSRIIT